MSDRLSRLAKKVDEVLSRLEMIKSENTTLKDGNRKLKAELLTLRKEHESLLLEKNDRTDHLKSKLVSVLSRLDELDSLAG